MNNYTSPNPGPWTGRTSEAQLYLHEKVILRPFFELNVQHDNAFAFLGYCCDEGVRRNFGRSGAVDGPDTIRTALAKMPNHLPPQATLFDVGNIHCANADMETVQSELAKAVDNLLEAKVFPLVIGGGHDIAYGHYNGIKQFLKGTTKSIGILNFDAHFDFRNNDMGNNSGTPFYQIAKDCKKDGGPFHYMCLGIRKDANSRVLFETATELGVRFIENGQFNLYHLKTVKREVERFMKTVDYIYATIDLDGFSSAYAPGVSAASPMGFPPDIVLEILGILIESKKFISLDIAEMNPKYDVDNQTAKLAASLLHFVIHGMEF